MVVTTCTRPARATPRIFTKTSSHTSTSAAAAAMAGARSTAKGWLSALTAATAIAPLPDHNSTQ